MKIKDKFNIIRKILLFMLIMRFSLKKTFLKVLSKTSFLSLPGVEKSLTSISCERLRKNKRYTPLCDSGFSTPLILLVKYNLLFKCNIFPEENYSSFVIYKF